MTENEVPLWRHCHLSIQLSTDLIYWGVFGLDLIAIWENIMKQPACTLWKWWCVSFCTILVYLSLLFIFAFKGFYLAFENKCGWWIISFFSPEFLNIHPRILRVYFASVLLPKVWLDLHSLPREVVRQLPTNSCCHSPTQPQLELEWDFKMGRKPPTTPPHHKLLRHFQAT